MLIEIYIKGETMCCCGDKLPFKKFPYGKKDNWIKKLIKWLRGY